jgi:hypothetical protein
VRSKVARPLVGGIQHDAVEAGRGERPHERQVGALIGHHHGHETHPALRQWPESLDAADGIAATEKADLHDVHARGRHGGGGRGHIPGAHRQIADGGARRASPGDAAHRLAHPARRPGAEGATARVLQVDEIGAEPERLIRLLEAGDAGEHEGHARRSCGRSG